MQTVVTVLEHGSLPVGGSPGALDESELRQLLSIAKLRPGFCTPGYRSVRFSGYVGLVRTGNRIIEILPKVGESNDVGSSRSTLLRMLRLALDLRIQSFGPASHAMVQGSLLDVFIGAYLESLTRLMTRGLSHRYRQREEDDLRVVRGRMLLMRQAGANAMRLDRVACRYDEFDIDHPWNQVLKAALMAVRPWIHRIDSGRRWVELRPAFDGVSTCTDPLDMVRGLVQDRQMAHYAEPLRWAEWILRLLSPRVRAGDAEAPGLLFDMNRLFEAAVANRMRKSAGQAGIQVRTQEGRHALLGEADSEATHLKLRPDLVLRKEGLAIAVGDTKWTRRIEMKASGHVVPPETHAYQMHAYAGRYDCQEFVLIYPWHDGLDGMTSPRYVLPAHGGEVRTLHVICVDVTSDGFPVRSIESGSIVESLFLR